MHKEGEIIFFFSQDLVSHHCWGLPRSNHYTHPSAFLKIYFHGNIMHFTDLLPFAPETPFYLLFLFWLSSLFVIGPKDRVEKAEHFLWILPNLCLWNQGSFAQICITPRQPGFTSGMSESFLGYENPSLKSTNKKQGERKLTEQ